MKSFNTVLNIILLIAVIFLLYREFAPATAQTAEQQEAETIANKDFSGLRMAYINYDSLVARYDYHNELKTQLEERAKAVEADLANRTRQFQENVALIQQQAGSLSEERLQQEQMELQQIQQRLMQYRDEKTQELAEQERQLTQLLRNDLDDVLGKIKEEYNLDLIFSYDSRSDVLAARDDLNITESVLTRLNKKYHDTKADSLQIAE